MKKHIKIAALLTAALILITAFSAALSAGAVSDGFKVTSTSNLFSTRVTEFDKSTDTLTTTWFLRITDASILNLQWTITYDSDALSISELNKDKRGRWNFMPGFPTRGICNPNIKDNPNLIKGNHSSLSLLDVCTDDGGSIPFVSVTWDVKEARDCKVDLCVEVITLALRDPWGSCDPSTEQLLVNNGQVMETDYTIDEAYASVYEGALDEDYTNPSDPPTTAAPATTAPDTTVQETTSSEEGTVPDKDIPTAEPTEAAPTDEPHTAPSHAPDDPDEPVTTAEPATGQDRESSYPPVGTEPEDSVLIIGDINGDGKVDSKDRIVLTRYLAKWSGYENAVNIQTADVNLDGKADAKDRIVLTRHLAKWSGYEQLPKTS